MVCQAISAKCNTGLLEPRSSRLSGAADASQDSRALNLDVLVVGGLPIREPTVFYEPFVMNSQDEIVQAIADYRAGRMGTIPATTLSL